MKQIIFIITLLFCLTTLSATEYTIELAKIENDITDEIALLGINEVDGEITSFYLTSYIDEVETSHSTYDVEKIYNGVVIMEMEGKKVVSLKSKDFDLIEGGKITIKYLNNGITGKYKKVDINLTRDNEWMLYGPDNAPISTIFCEGKKVLGKAVGIKTIHFQ